MQPHPIFSQFTSDPAFDGQTVDWLGMQYKSTWWALDEAVFDIMAPGFHEEYFEWIDLLEAIAAAGQESFTMVDLGAGFGRWGIRGVLAAQQRGIRKVNLRFAEAEPQHLAWLHEALELNKQQFKAEVDTRIDGRAISYSGKPVQFILGPIGVDPRRQYGQAAATTAYDTQPAERFYFGHPVHHVEGAELIYVEPVTFEGLTEDLEFIDLLDMDLQGAERELVENAADIFSAKVRLVHIATHSAEIENAIRDNFRARSWIPRWDFSLVGERETPYGPIQFCDGVQSWLNPRFPIVEDIPPLRASYTVANVRAPEPNRMADTFEIPLSQLVAREGARLVQQADAAILITPAGQWHYSAEAAFELPGIENHSCCINLSAQVEAGKIGIGWLNADGSDWVTRAFLDRTAAPEQVRLEIPAGTTGGCLILDNASDNGRPAVAVLYRLFIGGPD